MIDVERAWISHLGLYKPQFPRELMFERVGGVFRCTVRNLQEYVSVIRENVKKAGAWACNQSVPQVRDSVWDMVYLDVDSNDLENVSYPSMQKLVHELRSEYECNPRVNFTTGKGFAIYADIPPTELHKYQVKQFVHEMKDRHGLNLDTKVSIDPRRVSRLPYSFNHKSLRHGEGMLMCVPIDPDWDFDRIISEARHPGGFLHEPTPAPRLASELAEYPLPEILEYSTDIAPVSVDIDALVQVGKFIKDGRQRSIFYTIVPVCMGRDFTNEQTVDVVRTYIEASGKSFHSYHEYTKRSIEWHRNNPGMRPHSLERLMEEDPEIAVGFQYG